MTFRLIFKALRLFHFHHNKLSERRPGEDERAHGYRVGFRQCDTAARFRSYLAALAAPVSERAHAHLTASLISG